MAVRQLGHGLDGCRMVEAARPLRLGGARPANQRIWEVDGPGRRYSCSAEIAALRALGAPAGMGLLLATPTIAARNPGADRSLRLSGRLRPPASRHACQLFSEPQAGSDLRTLQARQSGSGGQWVVNGQKVWTQDGREADVGMLLARTDPEHQSIKVFLISPFPCSKTVSTSAR